MTKNERIVVTNDLDGVHVGWAPPPLFSTLDLARKRGTLPPVEEGLKPLVSKEGLLRKGVVLLHGIRPFKRGALEDAQRFRQAALLYQREVRMAILSGREPAIHALTKKRLKQAGYFSYFDDMYLNESTSASGWKEFVVRKLAAEGNSVVHIEDDLKAALRVARVNEEFQNITVLVYLLRNFSNHPLLLRRSGIQIPENVVLVSSFRQAADDFLSRLAENQI